MHITQTKDTRLNEDVVDLPKRLNVWKKYVNAGKSFKDLVIDRDEWRAIINKQAQLFRSKLAK